MLYQKVSESQSCLGKGLVLTGSMNPPLVGLAVISTEGLQDIDASCLLCSVKVVVHETRCLPSPWF